MCPQPRSEETHARILEAAQRCFARSGFDATGVAEICEQAGVSKGAFYHHFESKQAVFLALLERWLSGLDETLQSADAQSASAPERLEGLAGMVGQVLEVASGQIPMFLEFWRQAAREPHIWQATIQPYQRFRAAFADLVRQGIQEGTLRRVDPDLAAHVLVSLGVGLVLQGVLESEAGARRGGADQAVRLLLDGLAQERRP